MPYIGQTLQVAYPTYKNIDDVSSSFNGSTTSFALLVSGAAPVPLPLNSQQCLISVGGVLQRPDDTGAEGFRLSGGNIVFSSAPNTGEDFFGVILAGADYVNVGANFPDGSVAVPSITFDADTDTGFYRVSSGTVGLTSNGVAKTLTLLESAQTFTAAQRGTVSASGSVSGTVTLDFAVANNFSMTLPAGGSVTLANPSNQTAGQSGAIVITQNGTTAATVTYGSNWKFQGGAPTVSTTLSSVNVLAYYVESASRITAQLLTNTVS